MQHQRLWALLVVSATLHGLSLLALAYLSTTFQRLEQNNAHGFENNTHLEIVYIRPQSEHNTKPQEIVRHKTISARPAKPSGRNPRTRHKRRTKLDIDPQVMFGSIRKDFLPSKNSSAIFAAPGNRKTQRVDDIRELDAGFYNPLQLRKKNIGKRRGLVSSRTADGRVSIKRRGLFGKKVCFELDKDDEINRLSENIWMRSLNCY